MPATSVKSFISESENSENRKKVAFVNIEIPSLEQYAGLQFVDTPGLDSVFQHNTETALGWLPRPAWQWSPSASIRRSPRTIWH